MQQPQFASIKAYAERFTDVDYWRPYVQSVCARHGLAQCEEIRAGLPGTHPVFLVDGRYAVKFYTDLFGGAESFPIERELYALFAAAPHIPAPALIAHGELFSESASWTWPYIITQVIPGTSLGEVAADVVYENRVALAQYLGWVLRQLHELSLNRLQVLSPSWEAFERFLAEQRAACAGNQRHWQALPERLIAQIDAYVPSPQTLIDKTKRPRLLHCDLNEDHLVGSFKDGHWQPTGIIDFGDAKVGDPRYELVALHIGLFHCDKHLLRTFLQSYGWNELVDADFTLRAMSYTLLFEFGVLISVMQEFPAAREVETLELLADLLWAPNLPGLSERAGDRG